MLEDAHRDFAVRDGGQHRVVGAFHLHQAGVVDGARDLAEEGEAGSRQRPQSTSCSVPRSLAAPAMRCGHTPWVDRASSISRPYQRDHHAHHRVRCGVGQRRQCRR